MKKWLLHIMWVSVLGMLTASCSQEADDPTLDADMEQVMVRFTIALDEPTAPSRATWEGYDEDDNTTKNDEELGSVNENKINTVHAVLYDLNGVLMGKLNNVTVEADEESANEHIYTVVGAIEVNADQIADMDFKLMVLANCDLPNNLNDIPEHTFDNPNTTTDAGIPMWGIATYNDVNLTGCTTVTSAYDLMANKNTPVYMLRSMAKIQIRLSDKVIGDGFTLSPALSHYNTKGYCVPNYGTALPSSTITLDQETCIRVNNTGKGIDLPFIGNATDGYYVYVPEYVINMADGDVTNVVINLGLLKNGKTTSVKTTTLQFRNYVDGKPTGSKFDIVRNHIYDYTIDEINDGFKMNLTFKVMDWTLVEETWDFTDQVSHSIDGDLRFGELIENEFVPNSDVKSEVVYEGKDLYCQFFLQTPIGATWQAEFIPVSGDKNAFVFVNGNETSEKASGEVGKRATLVIRPAYASTEQTNHVLLRISVKTIDGRTIVVKDLLPEALGNVKEYTIIHSM